MDWMSWKLRQIGGGDDGAETGGTGAKQTVMIIRLLDG